VLHQAAIRAARFPGSFQTALIITHGPICFDRSS
jgi:hypothetical protein